MALVDKLAAPPDAVIHGKPCSVGALLSDESIPQAERDALQAMLNDRLWSQQMIWAALRDEGFQVGRQSINRHRGGKCRCAL